MVEADVFVSSKLVKRLEGYVKTTERGVFGLLYGVHHEDGVYILSSSIGPSGKPTQFGVAADNFQDVSQGLSLLGVWFKMNQGHLSVVVKQVWEKIVPKDIIKDYFGEGTCIVWPVGELDLKENQMSVEGAANGPHLYRLTTGDAPLVDLPVQSVTTSILDSALLFRIRSQFSIGFDYSNKKVDLRNNIIQAVASIQDKVGSDLAVFHVQDSPVLLSRNHAAYGPLEEDSPCIDLLKHITTEGEEVTEKKGKKKSSQVQSVVSVQLLLQASGKVAAANGITCAPIIHHEHREFQHVCIPLTLDAVVPVLPDVQLAKLSELLTQAVTRQLAVMEACLLTHTEDETFHIPKVHHFKPNCMDHICTIVYPEGVDEAKLESYRKALHHLLGLPADQPLLRRNVAYRFPGDVPADGYLTNTHIGLAPSAVDGGRQYLVDGTYTYHHYMQDRFDDDKWGCAYRSLQTLVSWLRHQGYTEKPVPSHRDIQQALVDMGDKQPNFVGSRQWIGSTEVSYVLDHLFEVSSKILFVSSGAEMASKARELALHFEKQGSPVMIGGGVLAHTILGVDFNDVTGDVKFLILDPHYTGAEDLQVIQEKTFSVTQESVAATSGSLAHARKVVGTHVEAVPTICDSIHCSLMLRLPEVAATLSCVLTDNVCLPSKNNN